jgi:hypothetical protein
MHKIIRNLFLKSAFSKPIKRQGSLRRSASLQPISVSLMDCQIAAQLK